MSNLSRALAPLLVIPLVACGSSSTGGDDPGDGAPRDETSISGDDTSIDEGGTEAGSDSGAAAETIDPTDTTAPPDAPPPVDSGAPESPPGFTGLHVEGNALVDQGKKIRLLGVNHSGAEFACVGNYGIFDGPTGDALVKPILTWKANTVRVPVNEQCWLGIAKGIDAKYSGAAYRTAVIDHVRAFRAAGLYVIFDLHWAAPGTSLAQDQLPMADADHAPDFWRSAATTFKDDPGVLFDLFNEPFLDGSNANTSDAWACLQKGCDVKSHDAGNGHVYPAYKSAGMQQLVDAVRSTGARNVIMVAGLAYTNDLSKWMAHKPSDAVGQLAVSAHLYDFNTCNDATCWAAWDTISKSVPFVTGELGEADCNKGFVERYMPWADARGISYLGWTWNTWDCGKGPAMISAYDGTPTPFGIGLRDHLRSL